CTLMTVAGSISHKLTAPTMGVATRRSLRSVPPVTATRTAPMKKTRNGRRLFIVIVLLPHQDAAQFLRDQHQQYARNEAIDPVEAEQRLPRMIDVPVHERIGQEADGTGRIEQPDDPPHVARPVKDMPLAVRRSGLRVHDIPPCSSARARKSITGSGNRNNETQPPQVTPMATEHQVGNAPTLPCPTVGGRKNARIGIGSR